MDREISPPMIVGAVVVGLLLLVGLGWLFLRPNSGADPRLQQKAQELKQRRQTVAPPTPQ